MLSVSMFSPNGLADSFEFLEFDCWNDMFSVAAVSSCRFVFLAISCDRRVYSCDFLSGIAIEESGSKASGGNGGKG